MASIPNNPQSPGPAVESKGSPHPTMASKYCWIFVCLAVAVTAAPADEAVDQVIPEDGCGTRIVGGVEAAPHEFPYQLRVLMKFGERTGLCGASIISPNWAMTAAHCVASKPDAVLLQVAYHDVTKKLGPEYTRTVDQVIVHPEYDDGGQGNDIALLKLNEPFVMDNFSSPVPLADNSTELNGTAIATGWGTTRSGGKPSNVLMKVELNILPDRNCRFVYPNYDPNVMLCAGYVTGGKDTCQGDSGGPLVREGVQVGVVSFGAGCAFPFFPGVYTRVSAFNEWIEATMAENQP